VPQENKTVSAVYLSTEKRWFKNNFHHSYASYIINT
jgi:hypothetical protein